MRPAATFVDNMYAISLQNNLCDSLYQLLLFFHVQPANQATITGVALCYKNVAHPWSRTYENTILVYGILYYRGTHVGNARPGVHVRHVISRQKNIRKKTDTNKERKRNVNNVTMRTSRKDPVTSGSISTSD
jgi:hypothetical protein